MLVKVGLSVEAARLHQEVENEMRAEALEKFRAEHDGMDYAQWKAKTGQHVGFSMNAGELFRRIKAKKTDHQAIMNRAYDRWQKSKNPHWTMQQFWDQLDPQERFAVFTGKLNQQVENGGFLQWNMNEYGTPEVVDYLLETLPRLNTKAVLAVVELLKQYQDAAKMLDEEIDEGEAEATDTFMGNVEHLDTEYYAINEQFMKDVQHALDTGSWKEVK